jgi:hypothetical protein
MYMSQVRNELNHIKAKYFFIRHYCNYHKLDLQHCPTEQMWADLLTKPLQGPKFSTMHAFLMNCPVEYSEDPPFIPSPLPTLNPTLSSKKLRTPTIQPPLTPTSVPMKPRIPVITPSSQGSVGTQSKGKSVHTKYSEPVEKKVTWRDAPFPQHPLVDLSSSKPNLHRVSSSKLDLHRVRPTAE